MTSTVSCAQDDPAARDHEATEAMTFSLQYEEEIPPLRYVVVDGRRLYASDLEEWPTLSAALSHGRRTVGDDFAVLVLLGDRGIDLLGSDGQQRPQAELGLVCRQLVIQLFFAKARDRQLAGATLRAAGRLSDAARAIAGGRDLTTGRTMSTCSLDSLSAAVGALRVAADDYDRALMELHESRRAR